MCRLPVILREEAITDLTDIYDFLADQSRSPEVAWTFVRRIGARCHSIGDAPHGGRPRDELHPGLRTVPFERSAVVACVVEDDIVRITNIFYGGGDYGALLGDTEG